MSQLEVERITGELANMVRILCSSVMFFFSVIKLCLRDRLHMCMDSLFLRYVYSIAKFRLRLFDTCTNSLYFHSCHSIYSFVLNVF